MLNINESMWRDSAPSTVKPVPNAWASGPEMHTIPKRGQFVPPNSEPTNGSTVPGKPVVPVNSGPNVGGPEGNPNAGPRLNFMFNREDIPDSLLYGGHPKMGLEDAMERLNMVMLLILFHENIAELQYR